MSWGRLDEDRPSPNSVINVADQTSSERYGEQIRALVDRSQWMSTSPRGPRESPPWKTRNGSSSEVGRWMRLQAGSSGRWAELAGKTPDGLTGSQGDEAAPRVAKTECLPPFSGTPAVSSFSN